MIAEIKQTEQGYLAQIVRQINHPIENVWAMLTDNEQLEKWFPELRVGKLQKGGFMKFEVPGVMEEQLEITEFEIFSVLDFDWFGDKVRFQLHPKQDGCLLVFTEKFKTLTEQTKKDLTGWHVCLDVIKALLDGKTIQRRKEWKKWHLEYARVIDELTNFQDE